MKLLVLAGALIGCKDAAPAALPGTLYFVRDNALAIHGRDVRFDDVGAQVFPSDQALPDGRLVGIASLGNGEPGSEQLVLISPSGKIERFGPAATQVRSPAVVGTTIVVEAKLDPSSQLYAIDAAGQSRQLTTDPQGNFTPAPLGSGVVFSSSRDGDAEIYKLDLATSQPTRLTAFHRDDWLPRPSPDGKTIAFLSDRERVPRIFLVDADGANLRRLTSRTDGEEVDPVWSPDGKSIAYTSIVVGKRSDLYLRDVAAGTERLLTPPGAKDAEVAFSPDGKWIAVSRDDDLWAIPTGGGEARRLTSTPKSVERLPRWR